MTAVLRLLYRLLRYLPPVVRRRLAAATSPAYRIGATVIATDPTGRILLAAHAYRPGWAPPGGMAKRREAPDDTARRELREELGVEVDLGVSRWLLDTERRLLVAVYEATLAPHSPPPRVRSPELTAVGWFAWDALPDHDELAAWILAAVGPAGRERGGSVGGSRGV